MTGTNFRLFHNALLALFNQKRARDLAHGILVQNIRAILSVNRRSKELDALRAQMPLRDTSDAELERRSTSARALASAGSGPSQGAAGSTATPLIEMAIKAI